MSYLNQALKLAEKGFHVFPLNPNSKLPAIEDFPNVASREESRIRSWWTDPVMEIEQPYNIGISTTKFADNKSLCVVDVDNKGNKKGDETILSLEMEGRAFPTTFTQKTPTGGKHLVYVTKAPVKQGVDVLGRGLDIRSRGGYIVASGSTIEGASYVDNGGVLDEAPTWIVETCGLAPAKETLAEVHAPTNLDQKRAFKRAKHYLENEAPLSQEGEGGDQTAFQVAARVKDFGCSENDCFTLMMDYWNDRCEPSWGDEELRTKIKNAYKYGNKPVGAEAPERDFTLVEEITPDNYLQVINKNYALLFEDGGHTVLHETIGADGKKAVRYLPEITFKRRFSPFTIQIGKGRPPTYAEQWLDWKGRREYQGLVFAPEQKVREGFYNLWTGFAVEPLAYEQANERQKRGFDLFMDHLKNNICMGDGELATWLTGYFAHMIQKPYERPLTTLAFKGLKGTGKNALIDRIGCILGERHYLVAHDSRYLTSNFNGHFDSCLCMVLDEAFWGGDKSNEGKLKGFTTAPSILIERKGKEPYKIQNLVRIIMIGNEDWIVPASHDERRYAVFQLGRDRMQDNEYFTEMRVCMDEQGGNRVLLDYLKKFDLSTVDVNRAPKTAALMEQKIESLTPLEQWWFDCLKEGCILGSEFSGVKWPEYLERNRFRDVFYKYLKDRQIRSRSPSAEWIGRMLKKVAVNVVSKQRRIDAEVKGIYEFPSLEQARSDWDKHMGQKGNWEG